MRLRFTVLGEPRAKERPRVYNGHAFTPDKEWLDAVDAILEAVKDGTMRKGENE